MSNQNSKKYDYKKVCVNELQSYVCYSHPTKRNEKDHVKQVTRSIKGLDAKQLDTLCLELDDLLENFNAYTNDLKSIEDVRATSKTKAFDWIIQEELINNSEKIVKSTLENYVPISKNSMVYVNALNSFVFKDYIPEKLCENNCQYVLLNDKEATEFSAVVEFKGFEYLKVYILNLLVKVIYNYFNCTEKCEIKSIFYAFLKLELDDEIAEKLEKSIIEIQKSYLKENKIKADDFHVCTNFDMYVHKKIDTEKIALIAILHNLITEKIDLNIEKLENSEGCVCCKLNSKDSIHKILHFNFTGDKESFFYVLDKMFCFSTPDESLARFVKEIRLRGNFTKDSNHDNENICILNNYSIDLENIISYIDDGGAKIYIDGILTNDYNLVNLLERIIVFGGIEKCDFSFKSIPINNDYYFLNEHLLGLLSKLNIVNHFKSIYANEYILAKAIINSTSTELLPIEKQTFKTFNILDHCDSLSLNIKTNFKSKIDKLINDEDFVDFYTEKVSKIVKLSLVESLVFSLYNHIFANDKLLSYDHDSIVYFISYYNKFMINNLNEISAKIHKFVTNDLNKIYNNLKKIEDKSFKKQCLLNAILLEIEIPYDYIKEICAKFEMGE